MSTKFCHPSLEASKMLEAALQQMDGIIAGAQMDLASLPDRSLSPPVSVVALCEKLKDLVQQNQDDSEVDDLDTETRDLLLDWLTDGRSKNIEEKVTRLENDKESLQLQVAVLNEQVDAQTEKIQELESNLQQKMKLFLQTEEQLQKEIMARSSLETQRLDFLSEMGNLKLCQAAFERENLDLKDKLRLAEIIESTSRLQCSSTGGQPLFSPPAASTPLHSFNATDASEAEKHGGFRAITPTFASVSALSVIPHTSPAASNAREGLPPRTPPSNSRRKIEHFGTMPRYQRDIASPGAQSPSAGVKYPPKGVAFGKGFNQFLSLRVSGKRSSSAPNLAETEKAPDGEGPPSVPPRSTAPKGTATVSPLRSSSTGQKPSGIKKIFTKLRRSSSGHVANDVGEGNDIKRGGIRSTATARLGWTTPNLSFKEPHHQFSSWTVESVENWMSHLGLSQYCAATRCWMDAGHHISKATPQQLEKDLGVRHPLHRKKLQLAISHRSLSDVSGPGQLDTPWVLRWLDDVGLPQYKDAFSDARIDGLVLQYLTFDDLIFLKIVNLLHVTSLKRGIQVLREHHFDPAALKRRAALGEEKFKSSSREVSLWTNHRVMEWLKTVDLSEYAPNLRGSGVHGALLMYEIRFTSELLASLLSISSTKTLLRRHLNTHFNELVGKEVVQIKRDLEVSPTYLPLTTIAKIKMPRKSQFSLKRRKTKVDLEFDDLLCPFDQLPPKFLQNSSNESS